MADNPSPGSMGPKWVWLLGAVCVGALLAMALNKLVLAPNAQPVPPTAEAAEVNVPATPLPTDKWVGVWTGVEGLRLDITKTGASYKLHIANMDGEGDFTGVPDGEAIVFERAGKPERIVAGDGQATGLKWLAGQANCLVIKPGEGFCRPEGAP